MEIVVDVFVLICQLLKELLETIVSWIVPSKHKSVSGEVALITGAASGVGRSLAIQFAKQGVRLILWDIDKEGLKETEDIVRKAGASVCIDVCDLSKKEEIKEAAERAREEVGDVTILVNNAGIAYCKNFIELTEFQIEQTFKINALSHFWMARQFLPNMMEKNRGHIVTVASIVGMAAVPGMPAYNSSKHAAVGFHHSIYYDLKKAGKTGVKTTLVCPFLIRSGMFTGVETKRNWMAPPLTPDGCAETIMHAMLTDREVVLLPRAMYIFLWASSWLSMKALWLVYVFMGADDAISKFRPTRSYQLADS